LLIFTRKVGQKIRIGDDIEITVLDIRKGSVKIGIEAPKGLFIHREEVYRRIIQENLSAAKSVLNSQEQFDDTKINIKKSQSAQVGKQSSGSQ